MDGRYVIKDEYNFVYIIPKDKVYIIKNPDGSGEVYNVCTDRKMCNLRKEQVEELFTYFTKVGGDVPLKFKTEEDKTE